MSSSKKWLFRLLALGFGLVLCELVLSLGAMVNPQMNYYLSPPWSRVLRPDPVLGHRMSPYYPGNDSQGFRNDKVPETCDILAIGDSMTYGFATTPGNSWPRQLERLSGQSVYNMSCGGYGPCEYKVLLEKGLALRPKTVLVGLTIGNDLIDAMSSVYMHDRFPEYRSTDNEVLREVEKDIGVSEALGRLLNDKRNGASQAGNSVKQWLSEHSSLYGLARALTISFNGAQYASFLREDDPPHDAYELVLQRPGRMGFCADQNLRTVFHAPEVYAANMDPKRHSVQEGLRISKSILLAMREQLRAQDIRLIVVLLPSKVAAYRDVLPKDPALAEKLLEALQHEEQLAKEIATFLQQHQVEFTDSTPAIRSCLTKGTRPYPESDDAHPNAQGYTAIAETVLPLITKKGLVEVDGR